MSAYDKGNRGKASAALAMRAAAALDLSHAWGERGPRTLMARQRIAAFLDGAGGAAGVTRDCRWIESVQRRIVDSASGR